MKLRSKPLWVALLLGVVLFLAWSGGAWAAEESTGRSELVLNIGKLINLLLVTTILVWVARKPLANFFASRSQAIRDQLAEAQKARLEAEAKLAEIESAMSSLDKELQQIRESADHEAQEEYKRLVAVAERDSAKIVERARQEIEGMTRTAELNLRAHVAELSVQLAQNRIQAEMTEEDRERLFDRFVTRVGGRT